MSFITYSLWVFLSFLIVILIIVGILLAVLLTLVAYTIRKYLLNKNKQSSEEKSPIELFDRSTSEESGFEVPFTVQPVKRQLAGYDHFCRLASNINDVSIVFNWKSFLLFFAKSKNMKLIKVSSQLKAHDFIIIEWTWWCC